MKRMRDFTVYYLSDDGVEEGCIIRARTHDEAAEKVQRMCGPVTIVEAEIEEDGEFYQWTGREIWQPWEAYDAAGKAVEI